MQLTQEEYFRLEAHEWKKRELEYDKKLIQLSKEITKRDITIMRLNIEKMLQSQSERDDQLMSLNVKIENVSVAKAKVTSQINERLGLETNNWGYNPETLEIIE